jgi:PKD repeat protein
LLPALFVLATCGDSTPTDTGNNTVAPSANFTSAPSGANPLTINFTDTSTPGSSAISAWSWTFGDGSTSTAQNPSHTYAAAGSFSVSLTVTTSVGSNARSAFVNPTAPTAAPSANFTSTAQTGTDPLLVTFTDNSTPGSSAITSWSWDFGDGQSSTQQNPTHTYTRGSQDQKFFDVKLTVTTTVGSDTKTSVAHVEVYKPIIIDAPTELLGGVSTTYNVNNTQTPLTATADPAALLREFRPVLDSAVITMWEGNRTDIDNCSSGVLVAEPGTPQFRDWLTYIPHRTGEDNRYLENNYSAVLAPRPADTWPGSLGSPTQFKNMRTLLQAGVTTKTGGSARWHSCEELTPFLSEWFSSHKYSYNQPIQQLARIRKYRFYRPISDGFFPLGEQTGTVQRTATNTRGVSNTKSFEFSASISASVTSESPGMNATLETTLTSTYGFTTTVYAEAAVGVTVTSPAPKQNYNLQWGLWEEVEVYRIEGPTAGLLWSDPNYAVNNPNSQLVLVNPTATVVQSAVWIRKPGT